MTYVFSEKKISEYRNVKPKVKLLTEDEVNEESSRYKVELHPADPER